MTLLRTLSLALVLAVVSFSADARTLHQVEDLPVFDRAGGTSEIGSRILYVTPGQVRAVKFRSGKSNASARIEQRRERSSSKGGGQIVAHPSGCPARAFCGCGASVEVFGRSIRELWLAANWFQFPRTSPAPGMVAVRRHHVFVIREVLGGNMVMAYDANSGGRQTRIHPRSLAGYVVVDPRAGRRSYAAVR